MKFKLIRYLHKAIFRKLDPVFAQLHVETVRPREQPLRSQFDSLLSIQHKDDLLPLDHVKNEQGRIFIGEKGFFDVVSVALCKVEASIVFFYTRMKVIDDPLFFKSLIFVVPEAVLIQPEGYFFLGDNDLSQPPRHRLLHYQTIGLHLRALEKARKLFNLYYR
jgi:hypothetical protein